MKTGVELIAEERLRQIEIKGYTSQEDSDLDDEQLSKAAACYALPFQDRETNKNGIPKHWPFRDEMWKPAEYRNDGFTSRIKDLKRAGALIAAEIDRLNNL